MVDPVTPTSLYAGTLVTGVIKGKDEGKSLNDDNTGLSAMKVQSLAADPINPGTIYTGMLNGVDKSTDRSMSWIAVNSYMIYAVEFHHVYTLAFDPSLPKTLYAGTQSGTVFVCHTHQ